MDSTNENDFFELEPFENYKPQEVSITFIFFSSTFHWLTLTYRQKTYAFTSIKLYRYQYDLEYNLALFLQ